MPVFLCGSRYDGIATPANLEATQKQIPGGELELFEGGPFFHPRPKSVRSYYLVSARGTQQLISTSAC